MDIIELNEIFDDYRFNEQQHQYFYKSIPVKTSVTQFISSKHKPFEKEILSKRIAERERTSQEEILKRWDEVNKISCEVGTLFHQRAEQLFAGKEIEIDYSKLQLTNTLIKDKVKERLEKLIPLQNKFFNDIKEKLIPIKTEFIVGHEDKIAGTMDLLCYNKTYNEFQIWDYKTNKKINKNNLYEDMLGEFSNLNNCELVKYSIQLNIYKQLLEEKLDIKIGKCNIIWFNENNEDYKIYECLNLEKEVKNALNNLYNNI